MPCAWQQFGRCTVKYLSLVRANGRTNQPLNPARRWRLDQSAAIPLMHGVLKMSRVMILRHPLLAKPFFYLLEVFDRRGAYTHGDGG